MADAYIVSTELYNTYSNRAMSTYSRKFETEEAAQAAFEAISSDTIAETYEIWVGEPCAVEASYGIVFDIDDKYEQYCALKSHTFYLENMEDCNA